MTPLNNQDALNLRQQALDAMWQGQTGEALRLYDAALAVAEDEEVAELITIGKAEALIAADQEGPELQKLAQIVMRRRSPRHVFMAAGVLMRKYNEAEDRKRALMYGELARNAAKEHGEPLQYGSVLNVYGIVLTSDSRFGDACAAFEEAIVVLGNVQPATSASITLRASIIGNLGGAKILMDDFEEGIYLINTALPDLTSEYAKAEACADLCLGYMQTERYQEAEYYGMEALDLACVARQTRNANHLLGELMVRTNRYDDAQDFFDVVAGYYPQYGSRVRELLMSVDLLKVVNWKG
jgi:tetratricopeptide (TPR) repeat protein